VKRLRAGNQSPTDPNVLRTIVQALFPAGNQVTQLPTPPADNEATEEVTEEEVLAMGRGLAPNKAPGPDSVPNRALKLALALQPGSFAELYNKCIREGTFPTRWKVQKLLLLLKPGKPREEASSYRPICLLDATGKVFERVIAARLEAAIEEAGGLSPKQYGFRKGRSTLRNVGFADDVALVIVAKHREEAERAANKAIETMEMWLQNAGLSLAPQKTEAVLVSSRKVLETATIRVGGMAITSQRAIKYLVEVMLENQMPWDAVA
ncbi:hypothetical protein KR074_011601, partial [Drosophila pseudoananassae]